MGLAAPLSNDVILESLKHTEDKLLLLEVLDSLRLLQVSFGDLLHGK